MSSDPKRAPRIGILGGGQLGRMMIEAASRLGLRDVFVLDPQPDSPAKQISQCASASVIGSFGSASDIANFVEKLAIDVLTVEIEHIATGFLEYLSPETRARLVVSPSVNVLGIIQDKAVQKAVLASHMVPIPRWATVSTPADVRDFFCNSEKRVARLYLKARMGAYDGRGNSVLNITPPEHEVGDSVEKEAFFDAAASMQLEDSRLQPILDMYSQCGGAYVEDTVDYDCELAVMVLAVPRNAQIVCADTDKDGLHLIPYPVVETFHSNGACVAVIAPARISEAISEKARDVACRAVRALLYGPKNGISKPTPIHARAIFGVELFYCSKDAQILVNEVAPRPHNTGHYTQDACATSQFENVMRVLANYAPGDTGLRVPFAGMINLFHHPADIKKETAGLPGFYDTMRRRAFETAGATVHFYGKQFDVVKVQACRPPGRKIGHINVVAPTVGCLLDRMNFIMGSDWSKLNDKINLSRTPAAPEFAGALLKSCSAGTQVCLGATKAQVGIIMGSDSDLKVMAEAAKELEKYEVEYEMTIVSAHRTPDRLREYALTAADRGIKVIIAGAGGAAHLPGMVAAQTALPVIGVPIALKHLGGVDSLLSILQMPRGVPVATVAVDNSTNAALLAIRILGPQHQRMILLQQEKMKEEVEVKISSLDMIGWREYLEKL